MAYFPNGTSGAIFQEKMCVDCLNFEDGGCGVFDVHLFYNYDQVDNDKFKAALNFLINDETNQCAMQRLK